jgi:hypothetical protein
MSEVNIKINVGEVLGGLTDIQSAVKDLSKSISNVFKESMKTSEEALSRKAA